MRLSNRLLSAALLATTLMAGPTLARDMPRLNGTPVVDEADILSPAQERALVQQLTRINAAQGHQVAVATVSTLDGEDVADFANRMFRYWKLGDAERNDGVLLLVAPNERKNKIEVGYGLEPVLTDAESNRINRSEILARFKQGDLPGGISAGVEAIGEVVNAPATAPQALTAPAPKRASGEGGSGWFWVILTVLLAGGGTIWALARSNRKREEALRERAEQQRRDRAQHAQDDAEAHRLARQLREQKRQDDLAAQAAAQKKRVLEDPGYYSPEGKLERNARNPSLNPYRTGSGRTPSKKPNFSNPPKTEKPKPKKSSSSSSSYTPSSSSSDDSWSRSSSSSSSSRSSWSSSDSSSSSSSSSSFDGGGGSSGGGGDSGSW